MIFLNAEDVRRCLPMSQAVAVMKSAYAAYSNGQAEMPLRSRLAIPSQAATSLLMPAYVQAEAGEALGVKIVSLFPGNPQRGLPFIQAMVLLVNPETGQPEALLEGRSLTAIRTGAASGAATDLLARSDCHSVAILGAGVQGRTQLEAICAVRAIQTAWIFDTDPSRVEDFISAMTGGSTIPTDLRRASSPAEAVTEADIICCATTSQRPVFEDRWLPDGVHINGIGSYTPEMQEIPVETIVRARVIVDARAACLAEAGDLIQPIQAGLITADHLAGEIGEVVLGLKIGREFESQVTCFKSVGLAVQDVMAARLTLVNAAQLGIGQFITWEA